MATTYSRTRFLATCTQSNGTSIGRCGSGRECKSRSPAGLPRDVQNLAEAELPVARTQRIALDQAEHEQVTDRSKLLCSDSFAQNIYQDVLAMIDESRAIPLLTREHGAQPFRVVVVHRGPGRCGRDGTSRPATRTLTRRPGADADCNPCPGPGGRVADGAGNPGAPTGRADRAFVGSVAQLLVAASYPLLVGKLILIGTPAFEEKYVPQLRDNRLRRLTDDERRELSHLSDLLSAEAKRPMRPSVVLATWPRRPTPTIRWSST